MEELRSIDTKTLKAIIYAIIDRIEFYEFMEKTPSCNDCARLNVCEVAPDYGAQVRYNCHLWKSQAQNDTDALNIAKKILSECER